MDWTTIQPVSQVSLSRSKRIFSLKRTCDLFTKCASRTSIMSSDNSNSPLTRTVFRFPLDFELPGFYYISFPIMSAQEGKGF